MAKILVTGATGYIGKRLIGTLLQDGHEVYALVRVKGTTITSNSNPNLHMIWGDLRNLVTLQEIPEDIDVAYYLVHSMGEISGQLIEIERKVAENFVQILKKTRTKQIIYLGGIVEKTHLSPHLESRLLVEGILKSSEIPTTILRASIIVGSGSASFEIIRDLVEKLPFMVAPRWISSLCQPIAVRDVLFYLKSVINNPQCSNQTFDIGGPNILSFKEMLLEFARLRGLKRYILTVPVLTPRLSSYWLVFVTPVRFSLASYLVESMKTNTICKDQRIKEILSHECITYEKAIQLAFTKISQNEVTSTWMDAWASDHITPDIQKYVEVPSHGVLKDVQTVAINGPLQPVMDRIWSIGGTQGWYSMNWAWQFRGMVDKLFGGVGLNRGRRHPTQLEPGDTIDFWRVLKSDTKTKNLILYAEMKLPGEAWLEFKIDENPHGAQLKQTATFRPKGLFGRLYWYLMFPFHLFIFRNMAKSIVNDG